MAEDHQGGRSVWVVSDGRAGIERQALSLALALENLPTDQTGPKACAPTLPRASWRREVVRLQPEGWRVVLPPNLWPAPLEALPVEQKGRLIAPWPELWIASGRRSIPYSRLVRRWSGGRTFVVQTQDPSVPASDFDLVIPPAHDQTPPRDNVFPILGAPTFFSSADVESAQVRFGRLRGQSGLKLLVSLGGNSRTHTMTPARASGIESTLRQLANSGANIWMTVSRRTPEPARKRFRDLAADIGAIFWENEQRDGPNPYLAFLSLCDAALVTEDSANMIGDPAYFGKPVHLLQLDGRSDRFDRLHQGFIARGAARWFSGSIETWAYEPVREADRAAAEILRRLNLPRTPSTRSRPDHVP